MSALSAVQAPPIATSAGGAPSVVTVDVAVVIPAYNERNGVGTTIDRVRTALGDIPGTSEIVVVDDGSTDGTGEQAESRGARVIRLNGNTGYGAALKAGIAGTVSEWIVILDADGTYPAEAIPRLMRLSAGADMVVGARAPSDASIPLVRRPAKWLLCRLASYLAERRIPDLNSGLRVMRRSALSSFLHLLPSGFSFTTTITLALLAAGRVVEYDPVVCQRRIGHSKLRARDFTNFVMLVLRTVVLFNPLKVFLPIGTVLFLIGFVKFIYDLFRWNLSETAVMAFLAAIVVWSVGLLADMIARLQFRPPGSG
jgi:glycosyltransferase involved in cell wall biosynthesis